MLWRNYDFLGVLVLKRFWVLLRIAIGCAGCIAVVGGVQAKATALTPFATYSYGDLYWQDIKSASYTWNDINHNGLINAGETVTFSIVMEKKYWGIEDFDPLKVWVDKEPSGKNIFTGEYVWDFDPSNKNMTDKSSGYQDPLSGKWKSDYSGKPWTGGTKTFSFGVSFATAGTYDLTASVMCSTDLGMIANPKPGVTAADWDGWTEEFHHFAKSPYSWPAQGETEKYELQVYAPVVPEPETYAMMMAGLGLMGAVMRRRQAKQ